MNKKLMRMAVVTAILIFTVLATVSCDVSDIVDGVSDALESYKSSSSSSESSSSPVSSVPTEEQEALAEKRAEKIEEITEYYESLDSGRLTDEGKTRLAEKLKNAKDVINGITNINGFDDIIEAYKDILDACYSDNILSNAVSDYKSELRRYSLAKNIDIHKPAMYASFSEKVSLELVKFDSLTSVAAMRAQLEASKLAVDRLANEIMATQTYFNVRIIDGLTGAVLNTKSVLQGDRPSSHFEYYENLHYGYGLDKTKVFTDYQTPVLQDKDIVLEYTSLPIYTIRFQDADGNLMNFSEQYEFKKALTPSQMGTPTNPGTNNIGEHYIFGNNKDLLGNYSSDGRNDWTIMRYSDCIKVYAGNNIPASDFPTPPTVADGEFAGWVCVYDFESDFSGGTLSNRPFTGTDITSGFVVRATYRPSTTATIVQNTPLAALSSTPTAVYEALLGNLSTRGGKGSTDEYCDPTFINGNERLSYADEGIAIGRSTDTTFRFLHGMGSFMYTKDNNLLTTASVVNKFNGTSANAMLHVDQNTYTAFDGEYMYALVIVRDDTVQNLREDDRAVLEKKMENGRELDFWSICDNVEIRYFLDINNKYTDIVCSQPPLYNPQDGTYSGGKLDIKSYADNAIRTMTIDREGNVVSYREGNFDVKQSSYVELIDLAPADDSRMTAKLFDSASVENGYAVGVRFNIQGYIDAVNSDDDYTNDFVWDMNDNTFKLAFSVQVNDRVEELKRSVSGDYVITSYYDVSTGASADSPVYSGLAVTEDGNPTGAIAGGVQGLLDETVTIQLVKS